MLISPFLTRAQKNYPKGRGISCSGREGEHLDHPCSASRRIPGRHDPCELRSRPHRRPEPARRQRLRLGRPDQRWGPADRLRRRGRQSERLHEPVPHGHRAHHGRGTDRQQRQERVHPSPRQAGPHRGERPREDAVRREARAHLAATAGRHVARPGPRIHGR